MSVDFCRRRLQVASSRFQIVPAETPPGGWDDWITRELGAWIPPVVGGDPDGEEPIGSTDPGSGPGSVDRVASLDTGFLNLVVAGPMSKIMDQIDDIRKRYLQLLGDGAARSSLKIRQKLDEFLASADPALTPKLAGELARLIGEGILVVGELDDLAR